MRVPSEATKSVVFLGGMEQGQFRPRATGFLVATVDPGSDFNMLYLVTAEHVVSMMSSAGIEMFVRLNMKDGSTETGNINNAPWSFHPDELNRTDVAATPFVIDQNKVDHTYIPFPHPEWKEAAIKGVPAISGVVAGMIERSFGLGDEVFIVGLFSLRHGKERNIPVVRIGNIAAMPDEPVLTEYCGYTDMYLIEAMSIAGLSGSPVFVNVPIDPALDPAIPNALRFNALRDDRFQGFDPNTMLWLRYPFVGLVHGHFDVRNLVDTVDEYGQDIKNINTGMSLVVPASKVMETLYQEELVQNRKEIEARWRAQSLPNTDS